MKEDISFVKHTICMYAIIINIGLRYDSCDEWGPGKKHSRSSSEQIETEIHINIIIAQKLIERRDAG